MTTNAQERLDQACWLELADITYDRLHIDRLAARDQEVWCVYGDNRSSIDRFVQLFNRGAGPSLSFHKMAIPADLGVVSFRDQQDLFEDEVRKDDSDFLDRPDPGTMARDFLTNLEDNRDLVEQFRLDQVLDRGYRQLSSGESRKLLILKAVTDGAGHLLIENPYDGLDIESCTEFDRIITLLTERGVKVLVVLSSRSDIPEWCTHLAWFQEGRLAGSGPREAMLEEIDAGIDGNGWQEIVQSRDEGGEDETSSELIRLVKGHAKYGTRTIFSELDFTVNQHQHTLISGPNGAGKSTLLGLVTGDHPDCYTNELYLFGNRRGTGESIWQIKKEMGIVSPALHREHYVPGNCLQIVVSGFFDSIGLYRKPSEQHRELANSWLQVIGLSSLATTPFRTLGYGEQRLVLIARALIKMPKLLVLDEPTHGLDDANRANLLDFLELVVEKQISTIVYVSHRRDEFRRFFKQHLRFDQLNPE